MEQIKSIKDPRVLLARALHSASFRRKEQKALLFGLESILWAHESGLAIETLFALDGEKSPLPALLASEGIMKQISETNYLIPYMAIVSTPSPKPLSQELIVVLDHLQDFGNIGTIVRTALAFGIRQFVTTDPTTDFFNRKTIEASRGAAFQVDLHHIPDLRQLKPAYQLAVTTVEKSQLQGFAKVSASKVALVFGNESRGVSPSVLALADMRLHIPMLGAMESLNVGVAAGITLYEMQIKVVLSMLIDKIKGSLGRELSCTAQWMRALFDQRLKESTPFTAEEAILMMIAACEALHVDEENRSLISSLTAKGYLSAEATLTPHGEEALARLWIVHEQVEEILLEGFTKEEAAQLRTLLKRAQANLGQRVAFDSNRPQQGD